MKKAENAAPEICSKTEGNMTYTEAVKLALAGEERGFGYLYQNTFDSKFYLAKKYMGDDAAAQDVLQEAYIRAFRHLDTLKDPEKFSGWFGIIVANMARNELKKKNPLLFSDLNQGEEEEEVEFQIEDTDASRQPELAYTQEETAHLVRQMLDSLSEEQRLCILMYHFEGASIRDVALAAGCSENTVKSRLSYGRKNLKIRAQELEKKGCKLYSVSPIALLVLLLGEESTSNAVLAESWTVSRMISDRIFSSLSSQIPADIFRGNNAARHVVKNPAPGGFAKSVAAKKSGGSAVSKTIAAIRYTAAGKAAAAAAVAVLAGGIAFGVSQSRSNAANEQAVQTQLQTQEEIAANETDSGVPSGEETGGNAGQGAAAIEIDTTTDAGKALRAYSFILSNPVNYEFEEGDGETLGYEYAIIHLENSDTVPTLLIKKSMLSSYNSLDYVRVFKYDPERDTVMAPREKIISGTGGGGARSWMGQAEDGRGLILVEGSGGTGEGYSSRITVSGLQLNRQKEMEVSNFLTADFGIVDIEWSAVDDLSQVDKWSAWQPPESAQYAQDAESVITEDGDRIVLTGTVGVYSYNEVLSLQGTSDPNPGYSDTSQTFVLIVLDSSQDLTLVSGDRQSNWTGTASLIDVSDAGISDYAGQHITFSIDGGRTYWPSDTSLPLGEPSTSDVHVLSSN